MCGIAGTFRLDGPATPDDVGTVRQMVELLASRGPDGAGVRQDGGAVLGHRRLSIIDLSEAASQPMPNEDGTVWVVYNGEVYNFEELRLELVGLGHRFRSRTDSEVLVHGYESWGTDGLLARLRGMFAFALHDTRRARLLMARDRLGIKPLYYATAPPGSRVAFASEVKALTGSGAVPSDGDLDALAGFLCLGSVPAPRTIARAVRCLPPGHYATVDRRGVVERRYWDADPAKESTDDPGELGRLLEDTVSRHLVSDVPLGIFLSGGVDSAGLLALACRAGGARLHTLTVAFSETELDEAPVARRVAEAHGTEHHEILVTDADFVHDLPRILESMDQPTHDGVNTYFVAKAARKAGLTVALSGAGGDEVFWGYPHYRGLTRRHGLLRVLARLPGGPRRLAVGGASALGWLVGRERWRRLAYLAEAASPERVYATVRGFFAPAQVAALLGLDGAAVDAALWRSFADVWPGPAGASSDVSELNRIELRRYLHDQLLRDTDVFGMAHAVEVRVPYLDHRVVEMATATVPRLKIDAAINKPLLVRAIDDPAVRELAARPKRGFSFPMRPWMLKHADALETLAVRSGRVDPTEASRLWRAFRAGRLHWSRAWALVVLGAGKRASVAGMA